MTSPRLRTLGSSPHNTLAIGDAENDPAMLADCEVSVTVANAVVSVRAVADITATELGGRGVAEIAGPIHSYFEGNRETGERGALTSVATRGSRRSLRRRGGRDGRG